MGYIGLFLIALVTVGIFYLIPQLLYALVILLCYLVIVLSMCIYIQLKTKRSNTSLNTSV